MEQKAGAPAGMPEVDILIEGVRVYDGTGQPWFPGNVAIKDGRIAGVGPAVNPVASRRMEAKGLALSPGFVDVHTHDKDILSHPRADNLIRQGITTVVSGNCGSGGYPVARHLQEVEGARPAVNYATLVGHGSIRRTVMGMADHRPGKKELRSMRSLAGQAMSEGALGMSSGLFYVPGAWAHSDEIVEICREIADQGGIYATHKRSAGGRIFEAIDETADVGRKTGITVEISHLKVLHRQGRTEDDRMEKVMDHIEGYRRDGIDIGWDIHPYPATSTSLSAVVIPEWVSEGGKMSERLKNSSVREKIHQEAAGKIAWMGGPDRISMVGAGWNGENLADVAAGRQEDPVLCAMDLVVEGNPRCVFHALRQEDVDRALTSELAIVASDGGVVAKADMEHPRNFGTFPRVIDEYVNRRRLLGLEEAIRKMTFTPARRFGITDRGLIRERMSADIVLFDPHGIRSNASFERPKAYPDGIKSVIVNGKLAWESGASRIGCWGTVIRGGK